jgi:hypothetical protein
MPHVVAKTHRGRQERSTVVAGATGTIRYWCDWNNSILPKVSPPVSHKFSRSSRATSTHFVECAPKVMHGLVFLHPPFALYSHNAWHCQRKYVTSASMRGDKFKCFLAQAQQINISAQCAEPTHTSANLLSMQLHAAAHQLQPVMITVLWSRWNGTSLLRPAQGCSAPICSERVPPMQVASS